MSRARRKEVAQNSEDSDNDIEPLIKRVALQDCNISLYLRQFRELGLIGTGEFGSVYKCIHKFDGCTYAIQKSPKPVAGSINETNLLNQLRMQAVIENHQNVVRYHFYWEENNHAITLNEYCNGGNLAGMIANLKEQNQMISEPKLLQLLLHVVKGLDYIHENQIAHLSIKPTNIFISKKNLNNDSAEEEVIYKIGGFDCITSIDNPQIEKSNLDIRYLPVEMCYKNYTYLREADIFSLGLTVYEAGGGGPLPEDGMDYGEIREGNLKKLSHCSSDFNNLLKMIIQSNSKKRPSAKCLINHQLFNPHVNCKSHLRELQAEKNKLSKQVQELQKNFEIITSNASDRSNTVRYVGGYNLRPICTRRSTRTKSRIVRKRRHWTSSSSE